jgi:hypothetical protein
MNDDFDELDRALFALPLATPPPGLRESILRATIEAPAPVAAVTRVEIAVIGCVLAVAAWMLLMVANDAALATALGAQISAAVRDLADPQTLLWLAAGTFVATLFTLGNFMPGTLGSRARRS